MAKKYSSINDQAAQAIRNSQNSLELLTKIDQALNSNESFLTVKTVDSNGNEVTSQIPTLGFFQQKLEQLFKYVKKLSSIDGNAASLQLTNNTFKRIITADLNNEPKAIGEINQISTFRTDPNWIFDSFLNPKISVELDLTGKVDENTRTILSKRFIVEFDKEVTLNEDGSETVELTTDGNLRLIEFNEKYKNKNNIDIVEFSQWLDTPGLVNRVDDNLIDQDYFRIEPNRLQFKGNFSILSTDIDTINKKLWYILDTLTYYDISDLTTSPKPIDLKVGDLISIIPSDSTVKSATIYKVAEISTITSEFRVRFEQVFGEEPIPIRLNAITYYSEKIPKRTVKISVGFDEYSVLFIKQVDDVNNIVGLDFSSGSGFFTNDLRLDNQNGELLSDYYITKVYDYGIALEDLVAKKVPNFYGIKPNAPVLDQTNFKVVQINSHLTQTVEAEAIRDLHNQKNNIVSQIVQIQTAIEKQNRLISTTKFESDADKKRAQDQLAQLTSQLNNKNQTKATIIADILASKKNLNKISPLYNVRGFFPMPEALTSTKTKPQEVVQFEVWFRRVSKSGAENPILTITDINNIAAQTASPLNTNVLSNLSKPKKVNGAFSNWEKYKTDARKRTQDPITGEWFWTIEDVTDANTPNINQIDLAINPGERLEIKIKSLSEVGWPETPLESDFSETLTIDFPDDLNSVLNEDEFILKEAQLDEMQVKFDRDLESRGLNIHLNTAIRDADIYYAHRSDVIASGFKDANGKIINLYDQLLSMVTKITTLEETINKAKGLLEVYIINRGNKTKLFNGNNLTFNLNLEDYMTKTKIGTQTAPVDSTSRTYENKLMIISDFSLFIKNAAENANLGILSYRGYGQPNGLQPSTFAYDGLGEDLDVLTNARGSRGIQATWLDPTSKILTSLITSNSVLTYDQAPVFATQLNNQFVWLQNKDLNGKYIYNSTIDQLDNNLFDTDILTNGASRIHNIVTSTDFNVGLYALNNATAQEAPVGSLIDTITDSKNWQINENPQSPVAVGKMATTIHPIINNLNDITDISAQLIRIIKPGDLDAITIPLNIYAKANTGTGVYEFDATPDASIPFVDTDYTSPLGTGDMPSLTGQVRKVSATDNRLVIELSSTESDIDMLKANDRIIIDGFGNAGLLNANGKILTIKSVNTGNNEITVDYTDSTLTTILAADTGAPIMIQLHKRYRESGKELYNYNVLGKVGSDTRYIENYIEIIADTTPDPTIHNKKLRFYMEDENNIRPFEFQLNFNITQYKPLLISSSLNR